ncbi:FAD/NAD(P)-binding protein [Streptomyces sp. NPDC002851]
MNHPGTPRNIAVVGAGAAGTLTAMRLLHHAAATDPVNLPADLASWAEDPAAPRIRLIDPGAATGHGLAFGTDVPTHLLNVRAAGMSADRDDPEHFVRWLDGRAQGQDFVPRALYGRYLADCLDAARASAGAARLDRVHDRVVGITHHPGQADAPLTLTLRTGRRLSVDAAVLALGNLPPDLTWAPSALRDSPMFLADPWTPGALDAVPDDRDVLLVGTGLTMVDVALTLRRTGRVIHAVSRRGLLPRPHVTAPYAVPQAPRLDPGAGLPALRRAVLRHLARCRRVYGDWRAGFDSLRPITSTVWQQLSAADRARFLAEDLRLWEAHRHRIPPASAAMLSDALAAGLVTLHKGTVADARPVGGALDVTLGAGADGGSARTLRVGAVVNCTGCPTDLTRADDPLITGLLAGGLASPAPVGGGFDTTPSGRLRPAPGHTPAPLWTLGSLRRGNLLETTAIPEIRCQADDLARALLRPAAVAVRAS